MEVYAFTAEQRLNEGEKSVINIQNHDLKEQLAHIQPLDEEDKTTIFKLIDKMHTNKKFKDLFQKNVAAL